MILYEAIFEIFLIGCSGISLANIIIIPYNKSIASALSK